MPSGAFQDAAVSPTARPRFTVVVPLYNKARYIGATMASVLAQEWPDFELLVVDDGSTDCGPDVVADLADPRVRLVHQVNSGVSITRNCAIDLARGEWIAFLDADDWEHPGYLSQLVALQDAHPDVDAVATRYVEFPDNEGGPPPAWRLPAAKPQVERITDLPQRWIRGPTLCTSSIAVRARLLRDMQPCFHPGDSYGEDLDLWFRIAERTPIALAHVPLAGYRTQVKGSLSTLDLPSAPAFIDRMRARAQAGCMDKAHAASAIAYIAQVQVDLARNALLVGRRRQALRCLLTARGGLLSKRWWLTAVMSLFWPTSLARRYVFRVRRRGQATATNQAISGSVDCPREVPRVTAVRRLACFRDDEHDHPDPA